jgi:hypothetical protein
MVKKLFIQHCLDVMHVEKKDVNVKFVHDMWKKGWQLKR